MDLFRQPGKIPAIGVRAFYAILSPRDPSRPEVSCNRATPWQAALEVGQLITPVGDSLAPYQPAQRYIVVDEQHVGADALPAGNLMRGGDRVGAEPVAGRHGAGSGRAVGVAGGVGARRVAGRVP